MNPQSPGNPRISEESEPFNSPPIPLNPLAALDGKYTSYLNGDLDDEEDDDIADQGSRALLGSREGTRGQERVAKFATGLWPQIKGIVIEVRSRPLVFCRAHLDLECTNAASDYGRAAVHRRTPRSSLSAWRASMTFGILPLTPLQRWRAMKEVDQLIMIIPVVLNLKGNLEMNLSARLGTAANVGELDDPKTRRGMILGNLTLLQVQAAVVSFVAAGVSLILGLMIPKMKGVQAKIDVRHPPVRLPLHEEGRKSGFPEYVSFCEISPPSLTGRLD